MRCDRVQQVFASHFCLLQHTNTRAIHIHIAVVLIVRMLMLCACMQGETKTVRVHQIFWKLVIPSWLKQMKEHLEAQGDIAVHTEHGEKEKKKQKTKKQYADEAARRAQIVRHLSPALLQPCQMRASSIRGATPAAQFVFYECRTTRDDQDNTRKRWEDAGHGEHFELFYPNNMKRPFKFKRYFSARLIVCTVSMHMAVRNSVLMLLAASPDYSYAPLMFNIAFGHAGAKSAAPYCQRTTVTRCV